MKNRIPFALNHITAPKLSSRELIDLSVRLGCVGVELRNDLSDKHLTDREFFDGEGPTALGLYASRQKACLLGLSEVYGFNRWTSEIGEKVRRLIEAAQKSGAESISLIPSNDGRQETDASRLSDLRSALSNILPMLDGTSLVALIEPLGFTTSSLRKKREALEAIEAVGGAGKYKLVHDTFHHHLAGEVDFFPAETGIVHISGVVDPALQPEQMRDEHRIAVNDQDRLGNVEQIASLLDAGYQGAFSYECFAPSVHADPSIEASLQESMKFIEAQLPKTLKA